MVKTPLVWIAPGGRKRTIAIAATGGDVTTNLSPGTGKRWVVLYGKIILVADANAANRYPAWFITDGTTVILDLGKKNTAVTAGLTKSMGISTRESEGAEDVTASLDSEMMLPEPTILEGADQLRITILAGLAGDSYSGNVVVMEYDV